jgi:hypothetical protein
MIEKGPEAQENPALRAVQRTDEACFLPYKTLANQSRLVRWWAMIGRLVALWHFYSGV